MPPIRSEKIEKLREKWRTKREKLKKSALRAVFSFKLPYFCVKIVKISENFTILPLCFEEVTSRDVKMTSFWRSRDMKIKSFWIMPPPHTESARFAPGRIRVASQSSGQARCGALLSHLGHVPPFGFS